MTFREIAIYADGWNERKREEWKDQIAIAHLTAKLSRIPLKQKKSDPEPFPSLESLLPKPPRTTQDRAAENRDRFKRWESAVNRRFKKKKAPKK